MVDLIYCVVNVLFFDIPLLYYYTNLNSSMICCLFSGDMYLSFGFSLSALSKLFLNVIPSKIFLNAIPLKHLLFFSAILLPIKFASAAFWIALFEAVFIASLVDFLTLSFLGTRSNTIF